MMFRNLVARFAFSTRNFPCPNCCFSSFSNPPVQLRSRRSNPHKLRSSVTGHQYFVTSAFAHSSTDLSTDSLTAEEAAKVLKIVNEVQRSEDLLKYFIPKKKADELVKRKNGREEILLLEEVISIVGPKNSNKFFCSVLDKPIPVSASAALFPPVTTEEINKTSSVLGLIIVGDRISWSVMDREMRQGSINLDVKTLRQVNYAFKPRMHFLTLLQEMEKVASHIPETEMCLVEEYPATVPTPYMFNFQLQMAQAKAMLLGILNSREKRPLVISIKTVAVARLFKTYVGHEKVSGQHLMDDMLLNKHLPYIEIPDRVLDAYINADSKVKEGLSQAFLLNLAYWRITKQVSS